MPETAEQEAESKLVWPPTKEDLRRLYVEQKLSARKIAKLYGLNYASEKTAESTMLYHLKRNGIKRRDCAEHIRKVTDEMAKDWIRRYEAGESLEQIAGGEVSPVTVFNHLRKRGVQLRDKVEAVIKAITKHQKRPFSGDLYEKAYLMGFARGDLYVTRHGRAVRVKTGTTHPAMAQLFEELFKRHGPVYKYPREAQWTGYEWSLDADLDHSFAFLLDAGLGVVEQWVNDKGTFLSFLAGFFDAEGSIYLHRTTSGFAPELMIANSNHSLIQKLGNELRRIGCFSSTEYQRQKSGRSGIRVSGDIWRIRIWRFDDVQKLLKQLPLMHAEKVAKARIALEISQPLRSPQSAHAVNNWNELQAKLNADRTKFLNEARILLKERAQISPDTTNGTRLMRKRRK